MNRTISKIIKCAYTEGNDWKTALDQFLLMYRTTPHTTTGISPAAALFKHQLNNGIPTIQQANQNQSSNKTMEDKRLKNKSYIDTKRHAKTSDNFYVDQQVLAKNFRKTSKMDSFYEKQPYIIKSVQKHSCIITKNGQSFTRHKAHLKVYNKPPPNRLKQTRSIRPSSPLQLRQYFTPSTILIDIEDEQPSDNESESVPVSSDNESEPATIPYGLTASEGEEEKDPTSTTTRSGRTVRKPTRFEN